MFPLPLVQQILINRNGVNDALAYGIYKVAMYQKASDYNAYKQIVYCYFNIDSEKVDDLTEYLKCELDKLDYVYDDDYRGFSSDGQSFDPEDIVSMLQEYGESNPIFHNRVIEFHKLRQIKDVLGVNFNIGYIIETHDKYGEYNGEPLVSVKKEIMFDFYKNREKKSEYEMVLFAMFMGVKSIIGNKDFCATTSDMIKCRMIGAKNKDAVNTILAENAKLQYFFETYTTRRKYYKLMMDLERFGYIQSCVSCNRRTYISCKLTQDELEQRAAEEIVNESDTLRLKRYHEAKRASRVRINERLKFVNGY